MIEIKKEKNMGQICWPNTGRGESHIPGALHCRSSTCLRLVDQIDRFFSLIENPQTKIPTNAYFSHQRAAKLSHRELKTFKWPFLVHF